MKLTLAECEPCADNPNFDCGSEDLETDSLHYSVYQLDDNFAHNFGFNYWQCVNYYLYNPLEEVIKVNILD